MSCWGGSQEVCASCRYWGGKRNISFTADFFEPLESEGKCCNALGGFRGCIMRENSSCRDWQSYK